MGRDMGYLSDKVSVKWIPEGLKWKRGLLLFSEVRNFLLSWNRKIKKKHVSSPIFFVKKMISRGSPEVTFCSWTKFQRAYGRSTFSKIVRRKNLIIPAAHGQLGKTDMGLSDMDSGRFGYGFWACGWFHIRSWSGLQPQKIYIRLASKKTEKGTPQMTS